MSICFLSYGRIAIHVDKIECEAVHRAVANLRRDLRRVFSAELTEDAAASIRIYIGTNGISEIAEELIDGEVIPKENLYGGNSIWTYSCEQVWE